MTDDDEEVVFPRDSPLPRIENSGLHSREGEGEDRKTEPPLGGEKLERLLLQLITKVEALGGSLHSHITEGNRATNDVLHTLETLVATQDKYHTWVTESHERLTQRVSTHDDVLGRHDSRITHLEQVVSDLEVQLSEVKRLIAEARQKAPLEP